MSLVVGSNLMAETMPRLAIALRWIMAAPVFVLCWVIGLTVGATALRSLGRALPYSNMAGIACATVCGALAGILTAPPDHRRLATHLFVGAPVAYLLYSTIDQYPSGGFAITQQLGLAGAIIGGGVVYAAIGRAYLDPDRAGGRAAETSRMAIRWLVAVLVAPLAYFAALTVALLWSNRYDVGPGGYITAVSLATSAGVLVGFLVVPPRHRARAFWVFAGAAFLIPLQEITLAAIHGRVQMADYLDLVGALLGCVAIDIPSRSLRNSSAANPGASARLGSSIHGDTPSFS